MTDPGQEKNPAKPNRRRLWTGVLYIALLAAGIFTALQIHTFVAARRAPRPHLRVAPELMRWSSSRPPASAPTYPSRLMDVAGAGSDAGLAPMETDPGTLAPPAGAVRRWGLRRHLPGCIQENANYDYPGSAEAVAAHYERMLVPMGFSRLDGTDTKAGRRIIFRKEQTHVTVSLRKLRPDAKILRISVTFMKWDDR